MQKIALIGLGGALGTILRYLLGAWIVPATPGFPTATLIINVTGCLAIGFLVVALDYWQVSEPYRLAILIGVLGGYTTFSTFGRETMDLVDAHRYAPALLNILLSNGLGLAGVVLGRWCARRWLVGA